MPGLQWVITALGLFAAMLGFCLLAVTAHEHRRSRWIPYTACAAVLFAAIITFSLSVRADLHVG